MLETNFFLNFLKKVFFQKIIDLYTCLGEVPKLGLGVRSGVYSIPKPNT